MIFNKKGIAWQTIGLLVLSLLVFFFILYLISKASPEAGSLLDRIFKLFGEF
ncbi:MAG: hypothetical protein ABIB43_05290 [archaeon]